MHGFVCSWCMIIKYYKFGLFWIESLHVLDMSPMIKLSEEKQSFNIVNDSSAVDNV